MVTYRRLVIVARILSGLCAGRDGEEVIADVRSAPVADGVPLLEKVAVTAGISVVALGFARTVVG